MKRNQVVLAITALNLAVLAIAAFTIRAAAQTPELPQPDYKATRVNWTRAPLASELPEWETAALSPTKRPVIKEPVNTIEQPKHEPTDAELRTELEAKIAREIKLLRIVYAEGRPDACFAKVRAGNSEIVLGPNAGFLDAVAESRVKGLPSWLAGVRVKEISAESVMLDAPSSKQEKHFDIKLTLTQPGTITVGPIRHDEPEGKHVPFPPEGKREGQERDNRDAKPEDRQIPEKTTEDANGDVTLGREDLDHKEAIEAAANALRPVVDENGHPIGLQIGEDTPEDNLLLKRGGKRGDIIKSVNGKAVKMLADAKRTIREEYDKGVREFEIGYERDGAPGHKIFRVPQK